LLDSQVQGGVPILVLHVEHRLERFRAVAHELHDVEPLLLDRDVEEGPAHGVAQPGAAGVPGEQDDDGHHALRRRGDVHRVRPVEVRLER
jgi:hypothetical protein